ncbi:MAG TPA: O-acetyl-ADP-ribose deacetylase [Terriglobales bacterium]|nr:O-acetyl-ADP-ribose deacetylase [Terriglobales bacterium]
MSDFVLRVTFDRGKILDFHGPADITKETTEAIVNAANSYLMGGGGVDGAIHRAGGPSILQECQRITAEIGQLPAGKAVLTTGGRLSAKYVIHTVGPVYRRGTEPPADTLASCYRESIRIADDHGIGSLSFPSISTGAYGYPIQEAADVAVPATVTALIPGTHVTHARFVLFDVATLSAYIRAFEKLHGSGALSPLKIERNTP